MVRSRPCGHATAAFASWLAGLVLALSSLVGCAGQAADPTSTEDSDPAGGSSSESASPNQSGGAQSSGTGETAGGGAGGNGGNANGGGNNGAGGGSNNTGSNERPEDEGFAYLPWGPNDAPIPDHYASLAGSGSSAPDCVKLANTNPGGAFWATAVAVCRAIAGEGEWPATSTVPSPPPAASAYEACLDAELAAMLHRALAWYARNPGEHPKIAFPADAAVSPCQVRIYELRVLDPSDPSHPGEDASGRVAVTVTAAGATADSDVTVDGEKADVVSTDGQPGLGTLVFLATPGAEPRTANVVVKTQRGNLAGTVLLPRADAPTGGESPPGEGGSSGGDAPQNGGSTSQGGSTEGSQDNPNGDTPNGDTPNGDTPSGDEPNGESGNGGSPGSPPGTDTSPGTGTGAGYSATP